MPNYQVVSKDTLASKRWQRYSNYDFAAGDVVTPLVLRELPKAAVSLPIAFVPFGENFIPASVNGFVPGKNLFVAPDGRWVGDYVPAAYRGYPFALANTESGNTVLCIDIDSDLLSDTDGEPFFNADGTVSQQVTDVLNFLAEVQASREAAARICVVLQRHNLIQPWPIEMESDSNVQKVEGLYRIDEAALNSLPAEAFSEIRQAGALPVVYCQLLSMQHLSKLNDLARAHAQVAQATANPPATLKDDLSLDFLKSGDTISFGNLN